MNSEIAKFAQNVQRVPFFLMLLGVSMATVNISKQVVLIHSEYTEPLLFLLLI